MTISATWNLMFTSKMLKFNLMTVMTGLVMSYYTGNLVKMIVFTYRYSSVEANED